MKQGSFPPAGLCCPRPSSGTTTPSDSLSATRHFPGPPVIGGNCFPDPAGSGPRRASPVPTTPFWPFHAPYAGGFLGTRSRLPGAVHGLRHWNAGSAPSWPARAGIPNDAAGFASCCGLASCTHPASTPGSRPMPGVLLPGTLASPRAGLTPAGCRELVARLRRGGPPLGSPRRPSYWTHIPSGIANGVPSSSPRVNQP